MGNRYKNRELVERALKGGLLQATINSFNSDAISSAFAQGTSASAASAVKAWQNFCHILNIDWMLLGLAVHQVTNIILSYIGFEIGIRQMSPLSIKQSYLSHVINHFTINRIENNFSYARTSQIVKLTLAGYVKIHHKMNPISGARKFAFTIELRIGRRVTPRTQNLSKPD